MSGNSSGMNTNENVLNMNRRERQLSFEKDSEGGYSTRSGESGHAATASRLVSSSPVPSPIQRLDDANHQDVDDCEAEDGSEELFVFARRTSTKAPEDTTTTTITTDTITTTVLSDGDDPIDDDDREAANNHNNPHDPRHNNTSSTEEPNVINIDDAIETLNMGMFQYMMLIASGLCFAADGMQVMVLSFLTIVLQDEWDLSNEASASLTSTLFAGALVGTLILGPLADRWGRKPVFLITVSIITCFGFIASTTNHYYSLLTVIFLMGIGVGGLVVPFDMLAEFLPSSSRGSSLLIIEYFWTIGCLYVVIVADMTLNTKENATNSNTDGSGSGGISDTTNVTGYDPTMNETYVQYSAEYVDAGNTNDDGPSWRLFVVFCTLPCLLALIIGVTLVPESARWLLSMGQDEEAMIVLRRAANMNYGSNARKCFRNPFSYRFDRIATTENTTDDHHHHHRHDDDHRYNNQNNDEDDHQHDDNEQINEDPHRGSSTLRRRRRRSRRRRSHAHGDDASLIVYPPGTRLAHDPHAEEHQKEATIADLLKPKWREITLRLWGTWAACFFGYYGTLITTTAVFAAAGSPSSDGGGDNSVASDGSSHHVTHKFDYSAIFVSSSAELVGTTVVILTIDRFGRIPLQVISYACAGISVCALCILADFHASRLLLMGLGFSARVFEMAGTCVTWVSTAEILTTEVRSTGHSTANAMGRIGAFFAPFVIAGDTGGGMMKLGITMLIVHAFTVLCVYKLPETMGKAMGAVDDDNDNNENIEPDGLVRVDDAAYGEENGDDGGLVVSTDSDAAKDGPTNGVFT